MKAEKREPKHICLYDWKYADNVNEHPIYSFLICSRFNVIIKKECRENIQLYEKMILETVPGCVISEKLKLQEQ